MIDMLHLKIVLRRGHYCSFPFFIMHTVAYAHTESPKPEFAIYIL